MQLAPGSTIDRYLVEGLIGRGGLAEVYRVRHAELGTRRALKLIMRESPGVLRRAIQEGQVQSRLKHENVVAVIDVFRVGEAPALVLEYVEGPTLDSMLREYHPSIVQADALGRGILSGLVHAHRAGLVHRDLKPANILMGIDRDEVVAKIADFGLARVCIDSLDVPAGPRLTRHGAMMGTPAYMAPEQYSDAATVDARADVFGVGAVLYELVTGVMAFPGYDAMSCYRSILQGSWRPVRELVPSAPERIVRAIEGALRAEASERIESAERLLNVWTGAAEGRRVDLPREARELWEPAHLALIRGLTPQILDTVAESGLPSPAQTRDLPAPPENMDVRSPTLTPPAQTPRTTQGPFSGGAEEATKGASAEEPEAEDFAPPRRAPLYAGLGLLLLLALLGVGLRAWWPDNTANASVSKVPTAAAPVEGPSPSAAPVQAAPEQAAPVAPSQRATPASNATASARARSPSTASTPAAAVVAVAEPRPETTSTTTAATTRGASTDNVTISGVSRAYLIASDGTRHSPGKVPPGHYTVSVFFEPTAPTAVMELDVAAGRNYALRCEPALRLCR